MIFIPAFLFFHLSRQVYLTYRDAPALGAGNQSDNAGLMRYQAGTVRAGPIGTLDKHDNKESLEIRLRWRVESAMTRSIVDAIYIYQIASEQRVPHISSGPNPLYWGRVDNRPVRNWRLYRGGGEGEERDVKPARPDKGYAMRRDGEAWRINESIGN